MSKLAAQALHEACNRGARVFGETVVAALATDGSHCRHSCFQHSAAHIMSPPLRSDPTTSQALLKSLAQ